MLEGPRFLFWSSKGLLGQIHNYKKVCLPIYDDSFSPRQLEMHRAGSILFHFVQSIIQQKSKILHYVLNIRMYQGMYVITN